MAARDVGMHDDREALLNTPGRVEAALAERFAGSDPVILEELAAFVGMSSVVELIWGAAHDALKFWAETPEFTPDCLANGYELEHVDLDHVIIRRGRGQS